MFCWITVVGGCCFDVYCMALVANAYMQEVMVVDAMILQMSVTRWRFGQI